MDFADSMWELLDSECAAEQAEQKTWHTNDRCTECGSDQLEMIDAHCTYTCRNCGSTRTLLNDTTVEWSQNKTHRMTNRVHSSSSIATGNPKLTRLNNWNGGNYRLRTLASNQEYIEKLCAKHDVDVRTIHSAQTLYKLTTEIKHAKNDNKTKIYRGNNRKSVMAACLFFGSKLDRVNLTHKHVCRIFDISEPDLSKGKKIFMNDLRKDPNNAPIVYQLQVSNPMNYIETIGRMLERRGLAFPQEAASYCETLIRKIAELYITSEHHDDSVACACVRYALQRLGYTVSAKLLGELRDISEITIVRIYENIQKFEAILEDEALFQEFLRFRDMNIQLTLKVIERDEAAAAEPPTGRRDCQEE